MSESQLEPQEPKSHEVILQEMHDNLLAIDAGASALHIEEAVLARITYARDLYGRDPSTKYNESRWIGILLTGAEATKEALAIVPPSPGHLITKLDEYLAAHPDDHHDEVVLSGK